MIATSELVIDLIVGDVGTSGHLQKNIRILPNPNMDLSTDE